MSGICGVPLYTLESSKSTGHKFPEMISYESFNYFAFPVSRESISSLPLAKHVLTMLISSWLAGIGCFLRVACLDHRRFSFDCFGPMPCTEAGSSTCSLFVLLLAILGTTAFVNTKRVERQQIRKCERSVWTLSLECPICRKL